MKELFSNNAEGTLSAGITDVDTTITLVDQPGAHKLAEVLQGESFQRATLTDSNAPGAVEIVHITDRVGLTLTIARGLESTAPVAWSAGAKISARVTAEMLGSFVKKEADFFNPGAEADGTNFGLIGYPLIKHKFPKVLNAPTFDWHRAGNSVAAAGGSVFVDLGVAPAWASANYQHGDVVVPAVANGYQYWASTNAGFLSNATADFSTPGDAVPFMSGGTQYGAWIPTALPLDFSVRFPTGALLVVEEVGFISTNASATTVPAVSIGGNIDSGTPDKTRFANAVSLSQISSAGGMQIHRIPVAAGGALVDEITFRLDAAATGGPFRGRFYWRGFFVEQP